MSKFNDAIEKAKKMSDKSSDEFLKNIKKSNYGYRDDAPKAVTKTTLDKQASRVGRNLFMFVSALILIIVIWIGIASVARHETPIQYIADGFNANKPAKWKPSTDLGDSYNFGGSGSQATSSQSSMTSQASNATNAGQSTLDQAINSQTNNNNNSY